MIDLVTLISRALEGLSDEEDPPITDYSELEEEPSERAAAIIARALSHRPAAPPSR